MFCRAGFPDLLGSLIIVLRMCQDVSDDCNEVRLSKRKSATETCYYLVNTFTSMARLEMPISFSVKDLPLVVLYADKGSKGLGGYVYAQHQGVMMWCHYGFYHQAVRDLKNTGNKAGGVHKNTKGVYMRAQLLSTLVWKFNYDPFNSGANKNLKHSALALFMQAHDERSPKFRKYSCRIGDAMNGLREVRVRTPSEVYNQMPLQLTYRVKGDLPKYSRWMAWMESAKNKLPEQDRMVLEDHYNVDAPPEKYLGDAHALNAIVREAHLAVNRVNDPAKEVRQLRSMFGTGRVVLETLTESIYDDCCGLYVANIATWSFFTHRFKNVKSPSDGVRYYVQMALGGWQNEVKFMIQTSEYNLKVFLQHFLINTN